MIFHASGEAELLRVLRRALAGDGFDGPVEPQIESVGSLEARLDAVERVDLFLVDDQSAMLGNILLVLAFRLAAGGTEILVANVGSYSTTDDGHVGGNDAHPRTPTIEHGLLRIDLRGSVDSEWEDVFEWEEHPEFDCYETLRDPTVGTESTILCSLAQPIECVRIPRSERVLEPRSRRVVCFDDQR